MMNILKASTSVMARDIRLPVWWVSWNLKLRFWTWS